MIMNILAQLNFLDIFFLIIVFRICYVAVKTGLAIEFFKFSGVLFATYVSLHYYTTLSDIIQRRFFYKYMPLEFMDFLIFLILAGAGYLGFVVLRSIFYHFIKLETVPRISQFGGFIFGLARGFLVIGLLAYILIISSVSYLSSAVKHSYSGVRACSISPGTYDWLWSSVFSKFSPQEKFNPTVTEVMDKVGRK
jgi:uncharacterized membrane protein required for colicin V production